MEAVENSSCEGGADRIKFGVLGGGNRRGCFDICKKLLADRMDRSTICAYIRNSISLRESYSHCPFWHAPRKTNRVAHLFSNRKIKERTNNLSDSRSAYVFCYSRGGPMVDGPTILDNGGGQRRTDGGRTPILGHGGGQVVQMGLDLGFYEVEIEGDTLTVVKSFLQIGWIDLPFVLEEDRWWTDPHIRPQWRPDMWRVSEICYLQDTLELKGLGMFLMLRIKFHLNVIQ
ncbi:hypothetical protein PVK06_020174 [Gossypium arboreum]|uniref:Uncharacterized protein n=1 Tax=Gossypium arboreum TaxID=29729 RepID=A0ABR0PLQ0_GOSAR|nr:hypothetical protein PVK06_020174 [Gossypium arboreum]